MNLVYHSTRNSEETATASEAILKGLTSDGGLFVPDSIPKLNVSLEDLTQMSYQEIAYAVMKEFLTDFTEEELKTCINNAYDSKFDTEEIAVTKKVDGAYYLELFHGATIAFKDMALSLLPHLMTLSLKQLKEDREVMILAATSGDTGKAALEGFKDVEGTCIKVFYPLDGVSAIQQQQMVSQEGKNVKVVGIHGNFDDAQTDVKRMFNDVDLREKLLAHHTQFSSDNSMNVGRLVPQVVYYVYAYAQLVKAGHIQNGDKVNFTVPTGNFGNILASYYAKQMGIPIGKFVCASNKNKVLFDFFETGKYDRNREFYVTTSSSMDILISSNLERMIYRIAGNDAKQCAKFMAALTKDGEYVITDAMKAELSEFFGAFGSEEETAVKIKEVYDKEGYVMDTHTAVAAVAYDKYKAATGDDKTPTVIASTASPYKFTRSVMDAIDPAYDAEDDFELVDELNKVSKTAIPKAIEEIRTAPVLHDTVCETAAMEDEVKKILGI